MTTSFAVTVAANSPTTVDDLLEKFGLPIWLLPKPVNSFSVSEDGVLTVKLPSAYSVKFNDELMINYDRKITAKLHHDSLTSIQGIETRKCCELIPVFPVPVCVKWCSKRVVGISMNAPHGDRISFSLLDASSSILEVNANQFVDAHSYGVPKASRPTIGFRYVAA